MGTGNYSSSEGDTVILNIYDHIDYEESDDPSHEMSMVFEDLMIDIAECLVGKTLKLDGKSWRTSEYGSNANELILAENDLYQIWAVEDSYGHTFITYGLHANLDGGMKGLARVHLPKRAERFFDDLQKLYPMMNVATSPWTSAQRKTCAERENELMAA